MTGESFFQLPVFDTYGFIILLSVFTLLLIFESFFELRERKHSRRQRWFTNAAVAAAGLPFARFLLLPVTVYFAHFLQQQNFGLLNWLEWPAALEWIIGLLLLDYGIYLWHRLNHVWPFLWRFHQVHHQDQDMDLTTAIRFHAGEIVLSVPYRLLVVLVSGVSPLMLLVYEIVFEACTLFHHSNLRLPVGAERWISKLIITPRIHGIHHSVVRKETDSNYSTVLVWWDRLHKTLRQNVPQKKILIGIPAAQNIKTNSFGRLMSLPFRKLKNWQFEDGHVPQRGPLPPKEKLQP